MITRFCLQYQYPALSATDKEKDIQNGWEVGKWWKRKFVQEYMPAIDVNNPSVHQFLIANGLKK
jgi:hypothetical protein